MMRRLSLAFLWVLCFRSNPALLAQGTFQNLGFESANLPAIPDGQPGEFVPFKTAFPFWTGYSGTNILTQALHNDSSGGGPNISILGPNYSPQYIIAGGYTALLQAGLDPFNKVDAALAQVGILPTYAQYLSLKASGGPVAASFAGQDISLFPVASGSNYILYEGDISRFAGQLGELRFSAEPTLSNPNNTFALDSINFLPIPEPGVGALCLVGGLVVGFRCRVQLWKMRRRS